MRIKQLIVERFLMLCEEAGIKLNELATRSGVTPSTVYSMLEPSREDIYITTIKKLCDGLDISIAEFFDTKEFRELEQEIE